MKNSLMPALTQDMHSASKVKMKEAASIFNLVRASEGYTDVSRAIVGSINTSVAEMSEKN